MSYKQTPLKDREGNILLPETIAAAVTDPALGKTQAEINAETITRVELVCDDDQHITLIDDPTPLTYEQVKALVDDTTKFVTLRYLDMWWMLPSYDDGGAIMFTSSDIQGGHVIVTRVILNDDGQMNNYSIVAEDADHKTDDMSVETAADGHRTYPTTHAVNGALDKKANTDGYYTELTSGMSEQLLSPDGITDEEPYIYRTSAGSTSISTGVAEIKSLYGNSIVWNQYAISTEVPSNRSGLTFTYNSTNKSCIINGIAESSNNASGWWGLVESRIGKRDNHKMYVSVKVLGGDFVGRVGFSLTNQTLYSLYPNDKRLDFIDIRTYTGTGNILDISWLQGTEFNNFEFTLDFFDLTQMFGEGNEPTTVEQFKQWFPNEYYEYNEGEIVNVNIDGLKTVGFNLWDGNNVFDAYMNSDDIHWAYSADSKSIALKCFPNTNYHINAVGNNLLRVASYNQEILPSGNFNVVIHKKEQPSSTQNADYTTDGGAKWLIVQVGKNWFTNNKDKVCINLSWSGYRNGDYEPYNEHNINIPVKEIKDADNNLLFPDGLLSAGNVRDEITSDKAIKRVYKYTFTGNERVVREAADRGLYSIIVPNIKRASTTNTVVGLLYTDSKYFIGVQTDWTNYNYAIMSNANQTNAIMVRNIDYINNGSGLLQTFVGKTIYYELDTPIEVEFKDVPQVFGEKLNLTYFVDDFGTEEFTTDSTNIVAPVAHSTFYMTNLRDKIRNIDGNTDAGALMNGSVDNLLTTLGTALGGTLTKTWDATNKKWMFSFAPNATNLNEEGGEQ